MIYYSILPSIPEMSALLEVLLAQVPAGFVTTHGRIAAALGDVIASRWVGHHVLHHRHLNQCCCHRIVRASGELGGYISGGVERKAEMLAREGVSVRGGRVDISEFGFDRFQTDSPLTQLKQMQHSLRAKISLRCRQRRPRLVAGVDVSYRPPNQAIAAYALFDVVTQQLVWSTTIQRTTSFPYIPSYLAFRELPVLIDLLDHVQRHDRMAQVLMVDGSGILHPRSAGLATLLGGYSTATENVSKTSEFFPYFPVFLPNPCKWVKASSSLVAD